MVLQILFFVAILALLGVLVRQAREQYLPVIAFAVLIVCLPLRENLKELSIFVASVLIVLAFVLNKSRKFTWQPLFYAVVGVYLLNFVGLLPTGDFNLANRRIDVMIPLVLFPVLFSMVQLSKRNVMLLLRFFVWIVIAVCVYGLLSYVIAKDEFSLKLIFLESKQFARFFAVDPFTSHPSALNIVLMMALPVSLYLRYHDGKQITLVEMLLAIVLPILVAFIVGARIGVAVFPVLLGLGYVFYCKFKPTIKWGIVATATVGLFVLFYILPYEIRDRFSDQSRVDFRSIAISAIQEKPILGWGTWQQPDLIACAERLKSLEIDHPYLLNHHHFHNVYLDVMVQFGIIGIIVLLILILWTFWTAIHQKNFILLSFIVMYIIVFLVDNVLQSHRWVMPFMFWFAFLVANQKNLIERKTQV